MAFALLSFLPHFKSCQGSRVTSEASNSREFKFCLLPFHNNINHCLKQEPYTLQPPKCCFLDGEAREHIRQVQQEEEKTAAYPPQRLHLLTRHITFDSQHPTYPAVSLARAPIQIVASITTSLQHHISHSATSHLRQHPLAHAP